ncbi:hypothetical protein J3Q64DRAFT_1736089 [Phycomyces blakesleeanus]
MFYCNICSTSFDNQKTLKSHNRDQHSSSLRIPLPNGEMTTVYRQSNSKFLCFCKKQFETINGFHRHYRKYNCQDTNNVLAIIHRDSEDTDNLTNINETSLSQVKDLKNSDSPFDTISFSTGTSEKIKLLTNSFYDAFDMCFKKMKEEKKWKLRSKRVVEDILYSYGTDLERENAVHSFIIDVSDSHVKNLFTDDEWAEITSDNNKKYTTLSEEILSLLKNINKPTVNEIRKEIFKYADIRYNNYSEDKSFHIDKICYAIETLIHKYQRNPNPLLVQQDEAWYNSHIWVPFIDSFYDNIDGINCVRNGPASHSSRKRKRAMQGEFEKKQTGSKPDMSIRIVSGGGKPLEFGACEASSFYDGPTDKKYRHESRIKLPKMLKDMLFDLCEYSDWDVEKIRHIEVVGYIQSALVIEFLSMNHPNGYICRLSRSKNYEIGYNVNTFPKTLEVLAMSLMMKFRVENCVKLITHPTFNINTVEDQPSPTLIESIPTP